MRYFDTSFLVPLILPEATSNNAAGIGSATCRASLGSRSTSSGSSCRDLPGNVPKLA